jgi:type 1 glutamine amidotransferase
MTRRRWSLVSGAALFAAVTLTAGALSSAQAPAAPAGGQGRGGGRGGNVGAGLFAAVDADKDGAVTRAEMKTAFEKWYAGSDGSSSGSIGQDQLAAAVTSALPPPPPPPAQGAQAACGGRSANPRTACPQDVEAMMKALPEKAPARPQRARKVLVLARAAGFVHSSIPLAAKMVEEMGKKTGAWTATTTYEASDITAENLKQYDLLVLDSTTGEFLDDPNDPAATEARKKALMDFVRGGKGLVGIHAATDSYHGNPAGRGAGARGPAAAPGGAGGRGFGRGGGGTGGMLAAMMVTQADKNADQRVTRDELSALAEAWFDKLDADKAGRVSQPDFAQRFAGVMPPPAAPPGGRGQGGPQVNAALWPEFNKMIGGWFKWHWNDPQVITVKIDDPRSPITAAFKGQSFEIRDETYTFPMDAWSRENVHVLTSVDYSKMSDADKALEPAGGRRTDGDYGLSWIRREGKGRVFVELHGHHERVYAITPMLEHMLAGMQYAIGDLKADDSPTVKSGTK